MGFNTNITICNDNLRDYERHAERFWRIVREGAYDGHVEPVQNMWGITVHPSCHADDTQLVAAGGNFSTLVYTGYYLPSHHTHEGQVALLRQWAESLGYALSRKKSGEPA